MNYQSLKEKSGKLAPLWKYKVTDNEYMQLKLELVNQFRECQSFVLEDMILYMAEWYRREYSQGVPSHEQIAQSLQISGFNQNDVVNALTQLLSTRHNLREKLESMGIDIINVNDYNQWFYSILYQGGIPINRVKEDYQKEGAANWSRVIASLLVRNVDFDNINYLPQTAAASESIHDFCDTIVEACLWNDHNRLPFYCNSPEDTRYVFFIEEIKKVREIIHEDRPFSMSWKLVIDELAGRLDVGYEITGSQRLSTDYLQNHGGTNTEFVSYRISTGNNEVSGPFYNKGVSSHRYQFRDLYDGESEILLIQNGTNDVVLSDQLDLSVPHVVHLDYDGRSYVMDNRRTKYDVRLIYDEYWTAYVDDNVIEGIAYTTNWGDSLRILSVEPGMKFVLKNTISGEEFVYGNLISWVECRRNAEGIVNNPFQEMVYSANEVVYEICNDNNERRPARNMQYRRRRDERWVSEPPIGRIYAKPDNENATPVRFINVGTMPSFRKVKSNESSCTFTIDWEEGTCKPQDAIKRNDGWYITKDRCRDGKYMTCIFTPCGQDYSFPLTIRVPFAGYSILDRNGQTLDPAENNQYIFVPCADFEYYTYQCQEIQFARIRISNLKEEIGKIDLQTNMQGNLLNLLQNNEVFRDRYLLKKPIVLTFESNTTVTPLQILLSPRPFYLNLDRSNNVLYIEDNRNNRYKRNTSIISVYPGADMNVVISPNEDGGYGVPEINDDTIEYVLMAGELMSGIKPQVLIPSNLNSDHDQVKQNLSNLICSELKGSRIDSPIWNRCTQWFDIVSNPDRMFDICFKDILEFEQICETPEEMMKLLFVLLVHVGNKDKFINNIRSNDGRSIFDFNRIPLDLNEDFWDEFWNINDENVMNYSLQIELLLHKYNPDPNRLPSILSGQINYTELCELVLNILFPVIFENR